MKYLFFIVLLAALSAKAQSHFSASPLLDSMNTSRESLHKKHMIVLASWAGANIIGSGIATGSTSGSDRSFHQMNVYWNIANLGIAAIGLLGRKSEMNGHSWGKTVKEQHKIETIIAVNGGLDIGYIMAGFYLKERGNRLNKTQLTGYGNSLLLQGAFLLAFDIFQYLDHRRNGKLLEKALGKWQAGPTANGLGMVYRL